ncbi:MAG: aminotransferase [bacterium]
MDATHLATLRRLDAAHLLHPFTDHTDLHRQGTHVIQEASGCYVTDETGQRLLDGLAGLWCVNVGYGRHEIADAVHRQMTAVCYYPSFFNTTTEPTILLADKLASLAPASLTKVFFSNSGSEANETALKLIRAYHKLRGRPGKTKILSRTFSYHGVGVATTSMTGLPSCYQPFDLPLPGFIHVPGPHPYGADSELSAAAYADWCLAETARIIAHEGADTIGALFAEPVQGAGGVIVPPPGHVRALRDLCHQHDILFVADEVITGFGRLGGWFASQMWGIEPDLLVMAKGITSGYVPLGATMVSDAMAETFEHGGYLAHGFTYSGHPVATSAGLANLAILEREGLVERVRDNVGPYFQQQLHALAEHPAVGEVRGAGLIGGIDLLPRGGKSQLATPPVLGAKAVGLLRKEGLIVRGIRDLIALAPPLIITRDEIDFVFAAIGGVLEKLWD